MRASPHKPSACPRMRSVSGTVIMGIYDPAEVAKVVEIPEGQEVAALIALGHPAQDPQAPARKDVDTLLRFE